MDKDEIRKAYGRIVAKAWADDAFKERLISDPLTVLKECGYNLPEGVEVKVLESTSSLIHLVLPPHPDSDETSAVDLEQRIAAGSDPGCDSICCTD